jgi:hypothetical protein
MSEILVYVVTGWVEVTLKLLDIIICGMGENQQKEIDLWRR